MSFRKSEELMERARDVLVGGVNSPVRAFKGVGGTPVVMARGEGAYLWDVDGNKLLDLVGSWGPMIVGHAHPDVVAAVIERTRLGTSYGAPNALEAELAEEVRRAFPAMEKVRFVSSGTEATMAALRLARGATGRSLIVKAAGCYHGHGDSLLVKAGSGVATLGLPDSPGVPAELARMTITVPYNDVPALERAFEQHKDAIAAFIVEPVVGNMGLVPPQDGYLKAIKEVCNRHGALLILDEVMTGFRVAYGGAQERYGVRADIVTLGKIIGGGLPVGAYGAGKALMGKVAPEGPIYQAGTLSGNPLAMAAGLTTLKLLRAPGAYQKLERTGATVQQGLEDAARKAGIDLCVQRVGSMFTAFFQQGPVRNEDDALKSDRKRFGVFFHAMLQRGVYLAPSQLEAAFLSLAMSDADLKLLADAAAESMAVVARG
ncbi:MAG: glutamate-1-semialdehyde 2,1-aminomutase [Deltaproteobacteria bacterium]|nr:glutamate-1-semialdehyde 2,1-aminomutase [Deltaproteobacteria bacterium]